MKKTLKSLRSRPLGSESQRATFLSCEQFARQVYSRKTCPLVEFWLHFLRNFNPVHLLIFWSSLLFFNLDQSDRSLWLNIPNLFQAERRGSFYCFTFISVLFNPSYVFFSLLRAKRIRISETPRRFQWLFEQISIFRCVNRVFFSISAAISLISSCRDQTVHRFKRHTI